MRSIPQLAGVRRCLAAVLSAAALSACADQLPMGDAGGALVRAPESALQAFQCTGSIHGTVSCASPGGGGASRVLIGGQNTNLKLTSSNVSYDAVTDTFAFDVTVQNLMNEAIGTPDGTVADPQGVQVFFSQSPVATVGTGTIEVANADGTDAFTGTNQPYYAYHQILAHNDVSAGKTWKFVIPGSVETFTFTVYVETDVQYLLVINEVLANPPAAANPSNPGSPDLTAEWFELYNAGTRKVELQGLVIADSAASGRRPYHLISSSVVVQPGAYVVLGNSSNTSQNGGVTVDYSYGGALSLANSLDAVKVARVYGTDTLTVNRTQYSNASVSAKDGISRELKNPALDNSNMDGSNWGDASVTSVFGPGGRGTPKAQNSTYTP